MSKTSEAIESGRTVYLQALKGSDYTHRVVKPSTNKKLGKRVRKGPASWKGAVIYTLTLEERNTCPTYCAMWEKCYGNNMPFAHRMSMPDSELMARLAKEIESLCATYQKVAIRLHVLGDFFSVEYTEFWIRHLEKYPNLYIWGYTAHKYDTNIGRDISYANRHFPDRCLIRFSNSKESCPKDGIYSANVFEEDDDSITCPEQLGKCESCADCGLCWNKNISKPIRFIEH